MTAPGTHAGGERPQEGGRTDRMVNEAKEKGRELAGQARSTLSETAQRTRSAASTAVDRGTTRAATDVRRIASAFRTTTDNLRGQGQGALAGAGDQVANTVERLADYLERADADTLRRDVGNFVRRQPALALGGLFAVGLLAARFLKSSEPEDERDFYRGRDFYSRQRELAGGYGYGDTYGTERGYGAPSYGTAGGYGASSGYGTAGSSGLGTGGPAAGGMAGGGLGTGGMGTGGRGAGGASAGGTSPGGLSAGGTGGGMSGGTSGGTSGGSSTRGGSTGGTHGRT